uniref:hypothetical protein n=1 Tax=uncultured Draconibacterium sp. TaxID=1573823 RepID=UPI003217B21C
MKNLLKFGEYSSQRMKVDFEESFFLESKCDSAIVGYNSVTGAIIYSLSELVDQMINEIEQEGESNHYESKGRLFAFCINFYKDYFEELDERDDVIPPILISDLYLYSNMPIKHMHINH